jgi:hypothetical protein
MGESRYQKHLINPHHPNPRAAHLLTDPTSPARREGRKSEGRIDGQGEGRRDGQGEEMTGRRDGQGYEMDKEKR